MNIHEYQAKKILNRYKINIPKGGIAYTPSEAKRVAQRVSPRGPWMMKAQIQSGARAQGHFLEKKAGRQGGVRYLAGRKDIAAEASKMLGATLRTPQTGSKGKLVSKVYVEEYRNVEKMFYASLVIDRMVPCITLLISPATNNIIDLSSKEPKQILRFNLGLQDKITLSHIDQIMAFLELSAKCRQNLKKFLNNMRRAFIDLDATLIEINPVGLDKKGNLVALDAKIAFDDNALYRHPDILELHDDYEEDNRVLKAHQYGFKYKELHDGSIGCIVNGDGLALTVDDLLKESPEKIACVLNVRSGVDKDRIAAGIKLIMTNPRVEGILINILGGFLRCNLVADGIISAASEVGLNVPLVARFEGTNKTEATNILNTSSLPILTADNIEDAVSTLIRAMEEND